ncbi:MAG: ferric reductase-like transmembrane domain-containing protein [Prevotellaceae bacterium]|jgi:DMSO/TMAO reductase YedYZ heme-binding membrane subunit|nr:ferric reductase-like transmembrane domain-containing protein [Prevotellaceae bacterium]
MIKLFIDFIQFLYTIAPLLTALGVLTLLAVVLSKSIKRHATIYYIVFSIPFVLVAIPFICRLLGIETFNFNSIPFLGGILRDYIHAGTLGFPLLIIIMYMGALNPKKPYVKKLLSIRKELSILSGFPILTHALIRVTNTFPHALGFFINGEASGEAANMLGAGISNFSFVLGVLMLALFLPLWITSFDAVHKRMGGAKWKKLQRWSYVLYAMLFIHAMGIQVGATLNPREGRRTPASAVEATAPIVDTTHNSANRGNSGLQQGAEHSERNNKEAVQAIAANGNRTEASTPTAVKGGHQPSIGFVDIKVAPQTRRYIHIASLLLIFGSYLYLRVKKARKE